MLQPIHKSGHGSFRNRFKDHAEQPAGAGEIPFPQGVAGIAGQRGMQDAGDFGLRLAASGPASAPVS